MAKTAFKQKIGLLVLSFVVSLAIMEMLLRLIGVIYLSPSEYINRKYISQMEGYRILCIGESTTGEGGKYSYPRQLETILNSKIKGMNFKVVNKGLPGVDTTIILSQLKSNLDRYKPSMVIAMMGINDLSDICSHKRMADNSQMRSTIKRFIKRLTVYKFVKLLLAKFHEKIILGKIYFDLGDYYWFLEDYSQAEEMFKKALEFYPNKDEIYFALGQCYYEQNKISEGEEMLKKSIQAKPGFTGRYIELALHYQTQKRYAEAEEYLQRCISLDPQKEQGYIYLGWAYSEQGKIDKAEAMFKKALELSRSDEGYNELGNFYSLIKDYKNAEKAFNEAMRLYPSFVQSYINLGWLYYEQGNFVGSEQLFKRAIEISPKDDNGYVELMRFYQQQGRLTEWEGLKTRFIELVRNTKNFNSETVDNYHRLKDMVLSRGIKLVCVQYPLRKLKSLTNIFYSTEGVIFVDNEEVFKNALKNGKFEDYFIDNFAGNFGHCTPKGNYLLANNIVDVLMKEFFTQDKLATIKNEPDKK